MLKPYCFFLFSLCSVFMYAQNFDHSKWDAILREHVNHQGSVDYNTIKNNTTELDTYLSELSKTSPTDNWSKNEKLAYWINAYNAFTVKLIIDNYPVKSIKDIKQPWDQKFIEIGDKTMSLNYIEHDILRKMNEPRIHFTIVCASISCPKLQNTAFEASKIETQLTKATKEFLADTSKNSLSQNSIKISKIFQWFAKDFKHDGTLIEFLNLYSETQISDKAEKSFTDYNWRLNE